MKYIFSEPGIYQLPVETENTLIYNVLSGLLLELCNNSARKTELEKEINSIIEYYGRKRIQEIMK